MLIDLGIEEEVINHWDHRIELGTSSAGGAGRVGDWIFTYY